MIENLLTEKKIGETHEKRAFDHRKPNLSEVFGVKWPFFHLQCPFIFSEDHVRNLLRGRRVGVTHENMGI